MATRPRRGPVIQNSGTTQGSGEGLRQQAGVLPSGGGDGRWRGDRSFNREDGIKVTLRRERGITKGDVLRVPFRFQVPPTGDLSRPFGFDWSTYQAIALGEMIRPGGRKLREISMDTMFLDRAAVNSTTGVVVWDGPADPQGMLEELAFIMGDDDDPRSEPQVFRLVMSQPAVWGPKPLVNMLAVMTSMTPTQKAESVGTEYTGITFKQWRPDASVKQTQLKIEPADDVHKLVAGDTLNEIAKDSHFRRASAWRIIAKANGITGVSAGDDDELAAWAKRHHKTKLKIPAKAPS